MRTTVVFWCLAVLSFSLAPGCTPSRAIRKIAPDELKSMVDRQADFVLIDVRRPEELQVMGTLPGYRNIPLEVFAARWSEAPRDRPLVIACNRAQRAAKAAAILAEHGYTDLSVCALNEYRERGYPLIHPKAPEAVGTAP